MQSIGERLEEARKRKGISLREAAEATKIRSDFLTGIEQNKFDFELPDIYKRGFLKNYARFLKLDPDKIIADYNAQQLSNSRLGKKNGSEWFGQLEVKSHDRDAPAEEDDEATEGEPSYGRIRPKHGPAAHGETPPPDERPERSEHREDEDEKIFYIKAGLVCVGTLALVFVIFGLIKAILGSGGESPAPEPELRDEPAVSENGETTGPDADSDVFTLTANGTVYVLVKQKSDNEELYRNTMSAGETVTLEKEGAVDILFTAGENIVIDHAGERLRPSSSGTAKISLD